MTDALETMEAEPQDDALEGLNYELGLEAPLDEVEARVERGEIWRLGDHLLMCGSSTDPRDVRRLFRHGKPDTVLTDPPYCSGGFQVSRPAGSKGTSSQRNKDIPGDLLSVRGYMVMLRLALGNADAIANYVFTEWRMWPFLYDVVEGELGYGVRSMIVWDKGRAGLGRGWRGQHELIMFSHRSLDTLWDKYAPGIGNVINLPNHRNEFHPTEKPVRVLGRILANSPWTELVYDPFCGSGSTLMAAQEHGIRSLSMELMPQYCDTAIARWEGATGRQAERLEARP